MGSPEVLSLFVMRRKGDTTGSTKRINQALTGWKGSITHDSRELIIIAHDNISKNQIAPKIM